MKLYNNPELSLEKLDERVPRNFRRDKYKFYHDEKKMAYNGKIKYSRHNLRYRKYQLERFHESENIKVVVRPKMLMHLPLEIANPFKTVHCLSLSY